MQENAMYSVISPEGCATILWRDVNEAKKAAAAFKPDARHCLELGVIDAVVSEPHGGAHMDYDEAARLLADGLHAALSEVAELRSGERIRSRRAVPRNGRVHRLTPTSSSPIGVSTGSTELSPDWRTACD